MINIIEKRSHTRAQTGGRMRPGARGRWTRAIAALLGVACARTSVKSDSDRDAASVNNAFHLSVPDSSSHALCTRLRTGLSVYRSQHGMYPASLGDSAYSGIVAGLGQATNPMIDNWGRPLRYSVAGEGYELWSVGIDGVPETADDVSCASRWSVTADTARHGTYPVRFTAAVCTEATINLAFYRSQHGRYPQTLRDSLFARIATEGRSPFTTVLDAWDWPLRYTVHGENFQLRSLGPDRTLETPDDIECTSWAELNRSRNRLLLSDEARAATDTSLPMTHPARLSAAACNRLRIALASYRARHGMYPDSLTEAAYLEILRAGWPPVITALDGWDRPFRYELTDDDFVLASRGADGVAPSGDDINCDFPFPE